MSDKKSGTIIENFPHELLYTVLIPFYFENNKDPKTLKIIEENDFNKNLFVKKEIIKRNSQLYDYIEDLFIEESSYFEANEITLTTFQDKIFIKSKHKIKKIFLQSIFNNVAIIGITIKFKSLKIIEHIHKQKLEISDIIKRYEIKTWIHSLFCKEFTDKFEIHYFDSYDGSNTAKTIRFHNFTDLIVKYGSSPIDNNVKNNIASYFLNRMSVDSMVNEDNFTKCKPYFGAEVFSSSEGIVSIYEMKPENANLTKIFVKKNFSSNCILFAYLLVLQEFYKLHHIKILTHKLFDRDTISVCDIDSKKIKVGLDKLESEMVIFNSKYHITTSSNFVWIRKIYENIYVSLKVGEYFNEVNSSIQVFKSYIEKKLSEEANKTSKRIDMHTKIFTSATICNALISIITALIFAICSEESENYVLTNIDRQFIFWIPVCVSCMYLFIILLFKIFSILKKLFQISQRNSKK